MDKIYFWVNEDDFLRLQSYSHFIDRKFPGNQQNPTVINGREMCTEQQPRSSFCEDCEDFLFLLRLNTTREDMCMFNI